MEQIVITKADGSTLNLFSRERPSVISKATQKVALLSDDMVTLTVVSAEPIDFDFGDTITIFGKRYKLNQLPESTKEGERNFTYDITLEGVQYDLIDVMFRLPEGSYGEQLYGDLQSHLTALIWNINRVYPDKWTLGTYPTGTDCKNLNAAGKNCLQVLQEYCDEYDVEFEIVTDTTTNTYTLNIAQHIGSTFAHTLQYGRGKGLYKLQRKNVSNAGITTRLYVYGSTENIPSDYAIERHTRLCLPEGKTRLTSFIEDATAKAQYGIKENEKTYDDIKPERIGSITALGDDVLTFYDSTMFDLNATNEDGSTKYLIADTTAKITFQTGNLAGYSFDVHTYNHETHAFVINKFQDENGMIFPSDTSEAFQLQKGDKYIIEDISLPDEYITAAEAKLLDKGTEELAKVSQPQVSYSLELDEQYFISIYGRKVPMEVLHVGDAIHVIDTQIGVDKEVRITRIERDLLKPHSYTIQLSDTVSMNTTIRVLNELQEMSNVVSINRLADPSVARRRWKTAQELLSMVFDPEGDYYTDKIKPLSIETTMLAVGAKSQQFVLQDVTFEPNYGGDYASLHISGGTLAHYNIPTTVSGVTTDGIKLWYFSKQTIDLDSSSAYYIYAKCNRNTQVGTWYISKEEIRVESEASYYHFLVGTVSSPIVQDDSSKVRCVSLTYGFSTINGRFIKTGRIESTAGSCYFDLDSNEIGGNITIKSGSTGYANLSDKPDLSKYTLYSEFQVTANEVSSNSTKIDTINNTINTAGWITAADGNTLYAAKSLESGNNIISYINQTATTTTINASKINLKGQVTFSMFDSSLQTTVNGKLNSGDVGSLAYLSSVSKSNLTSDLSNLIDGKANTSSLGSLAYKSSVSSAMLDSTVISGGYIITTLIDVDSLYVKHLKASLGYVTVTNDYSGLYINWNDGTNNRNVAKVTSGGFYCCSSTGSDLDSEFSTTRLQLNGGAGTAEIVNSSNGGGLHLAKGTQKVTVETWGANGLTLMFAGLPTSTTGLVSGQVWRDGTTLRIKA